MEPRRTPLYDAHRKLGGRMVEFAGWEMPVQYSGILSEHEAVRSRVGLFDVSHMGKVAFEGPGALEALQRLCTNDIARLSPGQATYTAVCYPTGGIVDDVVVYRTGADAYLACVNAATRAKDLAWFLEQASAGSGRGAAGTGTGARCRITDRSDEYAQLALQGRLAPTVLGGLTDVRLETIRFYHFATGRVDGREAIISRTGYTGEDGFELYVAPDDAEPLWWRLLEAGRPHGIAPCGLGCRDTLRLEMRYCLYGSDIDETTTPLEAGLDWLVKLDKGEFIGREALLRQKQEGLRRRLVGFEMADRGIARHGHRILVGGRRVGHVTSGGHSPSLGKAIGLGYVETEFSKVDTRLEVEIRSRNVPAVVVKTPFYRRPY